MNLEKINKKIIVFICMITLCFINSTCAYGISNIDSTEFIPKNIEKTTNGADVKINSSTTNGYELDVSMNTIGLDDGYYTAYLYENKSRDWSSYEAIAFDVVNECNSSVRINLNIKKNDNTVVSPSDDNVILTKMKNAQIMEKVHPSYGTIELPKDFKGTIYIPFNSFKEKDNLTSDNVNEISKVLSWGIIVTQSENEEKSFKVSKFSLITKGSDMDKYFNLNFSIKGDTTIEIPVVGETIYDYKIESINNVENINKNTVKFKIKESVDGITINDNGRLTLTPDVQEQQIQICAVLDENLSEIMDIQLLKSWTVDAKELDGTSKSIPRPDEVSTLTKNKKGSWINNNILIGTRISIIIITIVFGSLYWFWKKNANKWIKKKINYKKENNRL